MSTTTTTMRDRGDRYGPMEWAQLCIVVQEMLQQLLLLLYYYFIVFLTFVVEHTYSIVWLSSVKSFIGLATKMKICKLNS